MVEVNTPELKINEPVILNLGSFGISPKKNYYVPKPGGRKNSGRKKITIAQKIANLQKKIDALKLEQEDDNLSELSYNSLDSIPEEEDLHDLLKKKNEEINEMILYYEKKINQTKDWYGDIIKGFLVEKP
jgi:hypothetical protein